MGYTLSDAPRAEMCWPQAGRTGEQEMPVLCLPNAHLRSDGKCIRRDRLEGEFCEIVAASCRCQRVITTDSPSLISADSENGRAMEQIEIGIQLMKSPYPSNS